MEEDSICTFLKSFPSDSITIVLASRCSGMLRNEEEGIKKTRLPGANVENYLFKLQEEKVQYIDGIPVYSTLSLPSTNMNNPPTTKNNSNHMSSNTVPSTPFGIRRKWAPSPCLNTSSMLSTCFCTSSSGLGRRTSESKIRY